MAVQEGTGLLAENGSAAKVHNSELEIVKEQMSSTPLFAPEVEAALGEMYKRLQKTKDEGQQTSFVASTTPQSAPKQMTSKKVSPARSRNRSPAHSPMYSTRSSSIPRSRGGRSPHQNRELGWDPYFKKVSPAPQPIRNVRSEPLTPPQRTPLPELQSNLVNYFDQHTHDINRAERRLEEELRGIDGELRRRKAGSVSRSRVQSPSPRRLYQNNAIRQRPKINDPMISPPVNRDRGYSSYPSTDVTTPIGTPRPPVPLRNDYDKQISVPVPDLSTARQPLTPIPISSSGPQSHPRDSESLGPGAGSSVPVSRQSQPPVQIQSSPPPTLDPCALIETKLQQIREQLGDSSPKSQSQSVARDGTSAPPVARLQRGPESRPAAQPREVSPGLVVQPAVSPAISPADVDHVINTLQRSKAARKEVPLFDPRDQPPPLPIPTMGGSGVGDGLGTPRIPSLTNKIITPKQLPPKNLRMDEVIQKTRSLSPSRASLNRRNEVSTSPRIKLNVAAAVAAPEVHAPPPVPAAPDLGKQPTEDIYPGYTPSIRPMALPKSSYNARRKWEGVSYSDDATRRLLALRDEAKECHDVTHERICDLSTSLAQEAAETIPSPSPDNDDSPRGVNYPPPPKHTSDYKDQTEERIADGEGPLRVLDDIRKSFQDHNEAGESMLTLVSKIDEVVDQRELEERTKPEAREGLVKVGGLRTLRREKGPDGEKTELKWKDVWIEADNRELRFYPIDVKISRKSDQKPLGRVRYADTARLRENLGSDGVYFYFGLERHTNGKVSLFTLCASSEGARRSWCTFFNNQMRAVELMKVKSLPVAWSEEQPFIEEEPGVKEESRSQTRPNMRRGGMVINLDDE